MKNTDNNNTSRYTKLSDKQTKLYNELLIGNIILLPYSENRYYHFTDGNGTHNFTEKSFWKVIQLFCEIFDAEAYEVVKFKTDETSGITFASLSKRFHTWAAVNNAEATTADEDEIEEAAAPTPRTADDIMSEIFGNLEERGVITSRDSDEDDSDETPASEERGGNTAPEEAEPIYTAQPEQQARQQAVSRPTAARYTLRIYRDGERIDTFSFTDPNEAPDAFAAKYLLTFWETFDLAVLTADAGTEVFAWKKSVLL